MAQPARAALTAENGRASEHPAGKAYLDASASAVSLVERISDDAWGRLALGSWDLRMLVGHTSRAFTTVVDYVARPADSEQIPSPERYYGLLAQARPDIAAIDQRARQAGDELGTTPFASFADRAERARVTLADVDADDLVTTLGGGMKVANYLPTRTLELVVHGLDIAEATGLDVEFPTAVINETVALAGAAAVELSHGPALLRALTGRIALPPTFSVVP